MIMVNFVGAREGVTRENSATVAQDYAKWSDLIDRQTIGVLSVLHAAVWEESGIMPFPVPVSSLEDLRRLKFLTYEADGLSGGVHVMLNRR